MAIGVLSRLGSGSHAKNDERSVTEHVQVLLNSRRGGSVTALDYGLPDFTDIVHTIPEGVQTVQRWVRDLITNFEPRLCKVDVRFLPCDDPFLLYFDVTARYTAEPDRAFKIRTEMGVGGRFKVT